jgi:gamma-glutamylcyclotransferase (GGCT)/AIG2-like uncharacterized protein YtfP
MISARSNKSDSLLFVYGTLRSFTASHMALWLRERAVPVGPARTAGRLYDLGAYPGMIARRRKGEWVAGEVYRLLRPRATLRTLDVYESCSAGTRVRFVRVRHVVELARGRTARAWLYLYRLPTLPHTRIHEGDYERRASQRGSPEGSRRL